MDFLFKIRWRFNIKRVVYSFYSFQERETSKNDGSLFTQAECIVPVLTVLMRNDTRHENVGEEKLSQ